MISSDTGTHTTAALLHTSAENPITGSRSHTYTDGHLMRLIKAPCTAAGAAVWARLLHPGRGGNHCCKTTAGGRRRPGTVGGFSPQHWFAFGPRLVRCVAGVAGGTAVQYRHPRGGGRSGAGPRGSCSPAAELHTWAQIADVAARRRTPLSSGNAYRDSHAHALAHPAPTPPQAHPFAAALASATPHCPEWCKTSLLIKFCRSNPAKVCPSVHRPQAKCERGRASAWVRSGSGW